MLLTHSYKKLLDGAPQIMVEAGANYLYPAFFQFTVFFIQ